MPILYKQQSLDETIPLASEVLVESDLNCLSRDQQQHRMPQVRKWRKIKNPKATSEVETKHVASRVGNKRRNKVEINGDQKHSKILNDSLTSITV